MITRKNQQLSDKLNLLVTRAGTIVQNGIVEKKFLPDFETYFHWKLRHFNYGDRGVENPSADGEYTTKKVWFRATNQALREVHQVSEYKISVNELLVAYPGRKDTVKRDIDSLLGVVVKHHFDNPRKAKTASAKFVVQFISELSNLRFKSGAQVELQGIVLKPKKIRPVKGIIIRQTQSDDLEKEVPYYRFSLQNYMLGDISAIATVELPTDRANEIQKRVEKLIVMLRLFKVASVKYVSYQMYSDSILDFLSRGTMKSGSREVATEIGVIDRMDEQKLRKFWKKLDLTLPVNLYGSASDQNVDHISIAYAHYSDTLMRHNVIEGRIAGAVMGLEALILEDTKELSYKLGMRLSKIMSFLGENPRQIRKCLYDAYVARSTFAHGSRLKPNVFRKLNSRYGDIKNLLLNTLEYLRKLIVIMVVLKIDKNSFIEQIDYACIDDSANLQLGKLMLLVKPILV
ncbi:MAG: hypothetical protein WAP74_04545 [Patescibacteria group bacterium]